MCSSMEHFGMIVSVILIFESVKDHWTRPSGTTGHRKRPQIPNLRWPHLEKLELVQEKIEIKVLISLNLIARLIKIKYRFKILQLTIKPGLIGRPVLCFYCKNHQTNDGTMIVHWALFQIYKHLQCNNKTCDEDLHYQGAFLKFILGFWLVDIQRIRFVWRNLSFADTYSIWIIESFVLPQK